MKVQYLDISIRVGSGTTGRVFCTSILLACIRVGLVLALLEMDGSCFYLCAASVLHIRHIGHQRAILNFYRFTHLKRVVGYYG